MDYIHSLLIMEDNLLDDDTDTTLCIAPAVPTAEQPSLGGSDPEPGPSPGTNLPWCKCGICKVMPQEMENKCCGKTSKGDVSLIILDFNNCVWTRMYSNKQLGIVGTSEMTAMTIALGPSERPVIGNMCSIDMDILERGTARCALHVLSK